MKTSMSEPITYVQITNDEIDINALVSKITSQNTGAVCTFTGVVRGKTDREGFPEETIFLEYQAYTAMAETKMHQIADEIRARWLSITGIAVVQRIGQIFPGTQSVAVSCAASHRDTGVFEAARYGIDRVKEIVPIWKKEISPDGAVWVEGDYTPKPHE